MIRAITRPSTAKCTLPAYVSFLLSEPTMISCCRLAEIKAISHDSVNRFLNREDYEPIDLFDEVKPTLEMKGGTLSVDDTVLDKPYARYIAYLGYYWSGKHHRAVKGINLITLYYTDTKGKQQPVNFRLYDKSEEKTKNDYFLEMLDEVLAWGLEPEFMTGDCWYSRIKNLKRVRKNKLNFLFAVENNRLVSIDEGQWSQVQTLDVPKDGLVGWLKEFGNVKLFRTRLKDQVRHYVIHLSTDQLASITQGDFDKIHSQHWDIEQYHRAIKQVCNIESFQVRSKIAVKNHVFSAIFGFVQLQTLKATDVLRNCYQLRRVLFNEVISSFIETFSPKMKKMNPTFYGAVNA